MSSDSLLGFSTIFVGRELHLAFVDRHAAGRVALRVSVDEQYLFSESAETCREIDRGGRLAYAALLV